MNQMPMQKENVVSGAVGAFLFALVGGVIWYVLWQVGILASFSGFIGVICAIKGYSFFAKGESVRGIVIATVMAALVIVIAWYVCLSMDVYDAYQEWFANGEVDFTLTRGEAIASAYFFLTDPAIAASYLVDLGLGLLFCAGGCIGPIRNAVARVKAMQAAQDTVLETPADFTVETEPAKTAEPTSDENGDLPH